MCSLPDCDTPAGLDEQEMPANKADTNSTKIFGVINQPQCT
jgi:hypothetical protein